MAVTRNDVARAASVSAAVVSCVVNGGPRPVSEAARARVLKAITELGYRPDGVARYLRTGSTRSIGLVLPDISLSYFAEMTQRLSDLSDARGHQLLVSTFCGTNARPAREPSRRRAEQIRSTPRRAGGD